MKEISKVIFISAIIGSVIGLATHLMGAPAYVAGSVAGAVCGVVGPMLQSKNVSQV